MVNPEFPSIASLAWCHVYLEPQSTSEHGYKMVQVPVFFFFIRAMSHVLEYLKSGPGTSNLRTGCLAPFASTTPLAPRSEERRAKHGALAGGPAGPARTGADRRGPAGLGDGETWSRMGGVMNHDESIQKMKHT